MSSNIIKSAIEAEDITVLSTILNQHTHLIKDEQALDLLLTSSLVRQSNLLSYYLTQLGDMQKVKWDKEEVQKIIESIDAPTAPTQPAFIFRVVAKIAAQIEAFGDYLQEYPELKDVISKTFITQLHDVKQVKANKVFNAICENANEYNTAYFQIFDLLGVDGIEWFKDIPPPSEALIDYINAQGHIWHEVEFNAIYTRLLSPSMDARRDLVADVYLDIANHVIQTAKLDESCYPILEKMLANADVIAENTHSYRLSKMQLDKEITNDSLQNMLTSCQVRLNEYNQRLLKDKFQSVKNAVAYRDQFEGLDRV